MTKCKICGGAVRAGSVVHSHCIEELKDAIMSTLCDEYCRYPRECADSDELNEKHCDRCKIAELLGE